MYKHLFGPVPSRRLGISLGVDLVPAKICSLDCVYCEVGKTTQLTLQRKAYIPFSEIRAELLHYFEHHPDPDYITFSGSGEPTLNTCIGDTLQLIKSQKPNIPIAVLTNGTLLTDPDVREAIRDATVVLPSLDAVSQEVLEKINRPAAGLRVQDHIDALVTFRREFKQQIWLEIFILPGYNDQKKELQKFRDVILRIQPDRVQLNTLDRPGTIADLYAATHQDLHRIVDMWGLDCVEIIAASPERKNIQSYRSDLETAILETVARRPCTLQDLSDILGLHVNELNKYLNVLEKENKIQTIKLCRGYFYQLPAHKK